MERLRTTSQIALMFTIWSLALGVGCDMAPPVPAPKTFATWDAEGAAFQIQYPENWTVTGGGKQGNSWARFEQGRARIKVTSGIGGSLRADIARSGSLGLGGLTGAEIDEEMEPVAVVHAGRIDMVAEDFSNYQEQPAVMVNTKLGNVRRGEFSTSGGLGGVLHGYHTTALTKDRRITIMCTCPDSNWETLRPAFETVIASIARGSR